MPSIAIVILNYNGKQHLARFLPSVLATTYPGAQVVVADNGSTDGSVQWLEADYPQVDVLVHPSNEGFAGGYNWALHLVETDYYVLLNSDVEVTPNWIEPVLALMESDSGIAACQPKILSHVQRDTFEYAGAAGGWIDTWGYPLSRGRVFDVCEKDQGQYDQPQPIFWASGAALFIRAHCFHAVKGFDARFFAHQEEIDLCWRLQAAGYRIMACPASVVYHVGAGTLPRGGKKVYLNFRNNLRMLCKNLPKSRLVWTLPLRIGLDALSAWKGLLTGDPAFFTAIVKAHINVVLWLLRGAPGLYGERKALWRLQGVYRGSVVWNYFIRGKKRFQEIIG